MTFLSAGAQRFIGRPTRRIFGHLSEIGIDVTPEARMLSDMKDQEKGRTCFVIGNGPSLSTADLGLLENEFCIASNRIYLAFEDTDWRPSILTAEDDQIIRASLPELMTATAGLRMIRRVPGTKIPRTPDMIRFDYVPTPPADRLNPSNIPFSFRPAVGFGCGYTITYTNIQLAVHLGFSRIVLLGVDWTAPGLMEQADGRTARHDPQVRSHFKQGYIKEDERVNVPRLSIQYAAFRKAQKVADGLGIEIINASRGGKLDVFQRQRLEEVLTSLD